MNATKSNLGTRFTLQKHVYLSFPKKLVGQLNFTVMFHYKLVTGSC